MIYNYQKSNRFFAQAADDIKGIAEDELRALGATGLKQAYRGIYFTAKKNALYSINFQTQLINRILAPLITFPCQSDRHLYKKASKIPWKDFLSPAHTLAVFATVTNSSIRHSKYAALRLKDAIVDYFRSRTGSRPSVDTRNPDVWFNLYIENDEATISLDTSGGSLHRRGYRREAVAAPMIETLTASLLTHAKWNGSTPLYDPFCGSGTILCEAFLRASHTPPAFLRTKFGFERLPDFDPILWERIRKEGMKQITPISKGLVAGSDISGGAVELARKNCGVIDKERVISIQQRDVFDIEKLEGMTIICNPPYGIRSGKGKDLSGFYKNFGDFLKQRCAGSTAYVYFGERQYIKNIGLKASWKKPLNNGGLDGRLVKFDLY